MSNISYSVYIEDEMDEEYSISSSPSRKILAMRSHSWVDDSSVSSCYNCDRSFTILYRRHHCRLCGNIFCYECINYFATIPDDLLSNKRKNSLMEYISNYMHGKLTTTNNVKHKVCKECFDLIGKIQSVKKIIDLILILKLNIYELKTISQVCILWNNATSYVLSIFRNLQYKLPMDTYNDIEKTMLFNNLHYFSGHNRYILRLIDISDNENMDNKLIKLLQKPKQITCWTLMCSRTCHEKLNSHDVINALSYIYKSKNRLNRIKLKSVILKYLECDDIELKCYLPFLTYYLRYDNGLGDFLIDSCSNSNNLINSLYWELQQYQNDCNIYKNMLGKLVMVGTEKHVQLNDSKLFITMLNNIYKQIYQENKRYDQIKDNFNFEKEIYCPLSCDTKIKEIHIKDIKIKNSATQPLLVPCLTSDNKIIKILYKKEDVRKDQIIMNILNIANRIIKEEIGIDANVILYNILPIDNKSGLIEIVEECETIYYIKQHLDTSILNYILNKNDNSNIKDIRNRFIKSTAIYCVITYLLGIGDRHMDNIMVTESGTLFHIDFGYILGNDPIIANPGIRITPEMIETIGGINSKYYEEFTQLCTTIYNCLRKHVDLFMNILLLLPKISDIKISESEIKKQIIQRFIPGENNINAKLHIVSKIENQSYLYTIKDWCHYYNKEKTITSTFSKLLNFINKE